MADRTPIITLTTDFGSADGTVGAMIGVIKSIVPAADVVNLTTDIPAHDIRRGAWALYQSVPFFPAGTIHVAVVDPGVGSERRCLLIETAREFLIGPDNGLLSWAWRFHGVRRAFAIENLSYRLARVGVTFDGRDTFAPAAAHLAQGADPASYGPEIADPVVLTWPEPVRDGQAGIKGTVLVVDHFGNLITNVPAAVVGEVFADEPIEIRSAGGAIARLHKCYEEISGDLGGVINGSGLIEIAGRQRSAQAITGMQPGDEVMFCKGGGAR